MTQVVLLFFAAVLLFSSFKLLSAGDADGDDEDDLSQNFIVKTCKCVTPRSAACTCCSCSRTLQQVTTGDRRVAVSTAYRRRVAADRGI